MCGIFGFTWNDKKLLHKMSLVLRHRGSDASGFFEDSGISLGHNRLSIIDITKAGNQPIYNEDNSLVLICNGEIYNYVQLKESLIEKGHIFRTGSDSEVILHLYEEYGISLVSILNGIFAFTIYDSNTKKIILARDHLGVKPLYYSQFNASFEHNFIFASELKAIIECEQLQPKFNTERLSSYLSFRYVPGSQTLIKGINKLKPAQILEYDLKTRVISIRNYWDFKLHPTLNNITSLRLLKKQLRDSVRKQLMSDVPVGVFLSGGLDSTSVLSLMKQNIDYLENFGISKQINSYVVGYDSSNYNENDITSAKFASDYFETNHHEIHLSSNVLDNLSSIIWHLDEPISDATAIPTYYLAKEAKKSVKVVLTGEGADEIFGGYVQYKTLETIKKFRPMLPFKRNLPSLVSLLPVSLLSRFFDYPGSIGEEGKQRLQELASYLSDDVRNYLSLISVFSEKEKKLLLQKTSSANTPTGFLKHDVSEVNLSDVVVSETQAFFSNKRSLLDNIFIRENKTWLPEYILPKLDRMTMSFSLEGRVPFLDKDLVSLSCNIPRKFKQNKQIFRDAMKSSLPKQIVRRKKYPFSIPIDEWLIRDHQNLVEQSLFKSSFITSYFSKKYLETLSSKKSSNVLHSRQLWSLITLSKWHNKFIEK